MKKLAALGFAVLLALAMSAATFDTGEAGHRDRDGFSFGLSFGTPYYYDHYPRYRYRPAPVYRYEYPVAPRRSYGGDWNAHVAWCYDRYRSYRASDNTFQPYDGPRRECRSPYWG